MYLTPHTCTFFIFQNMVKWPFNDLTNPTKFGFNNVHNFYMNVEADVKIGIWHFIPPPLVYNWKEDSKRNVKEHFESYFKLHDERPIVIYSHGNDGDRSAGHRTGLCNNLANLGYHVFIIDYRGFGDSSGWPSEQGIINDVMVLYNFLKSFQNKAKIFLWGHSLGTGVSIHTAKILSEFKSPPNGIILEAAYKNISQAAKDYIIAPLFLNNPWIISKGDEALEILNLQFNTAEHIVKTNAKILMLHSEDDTIIPIYHSKELREICDRQRPKEYPPVTLVEFEKKHGLGHNNIYKHSEIYPMIKNFIESK